jgi:hypothetical protein
MSFSLYLPSATSSGLLPPGHGLDDATISQAIAAGLRRCTYRPVHGGYPDRSRERPIEWSYPRWVFECGCSTYRADEIGWDEARQRHYCLTHGGPLVFCDRLGDKD